MKLIFFVFILIPLLSSVMGKCKYENENHNECVYKSQIFSGDKIYKYKETRFYKVITKINYFPIYHTIYVKKSIIYKYN